MTDTLIKNIARVRARINAAEKLSDRSTGIVQLIAVSKTRSANEVSAAFGAGLRDFGENYLQEALQKQQHLQHLPITWHFIGPIQANKTAAIAQHFDWVHGVDRSKIARRLSAQRSGTTPLNICIQVNVSNEPSKAGVALADVAALAGEIVPLPRLTLRGLMAIPAPDLDDQQLAAAFGQLNNALQQLNKSGFALDTLSMGMSNDLECASSAGATMVRIGTAIFGPRKPGPRSTIT